MKERVLHMGGKMVISSCVGHGTETVITLQRPTMSQPPSDNAQFQDA
jgi:signal transduction histidine kinase